MKHRGPPMAPTCGEWAQLGIYIGSSYVFKMTAAMVDTISFYLGVSFFTRYLQIDPTAEHDIDREEVREFSRRQADIMAAFTIVRRCFDRKPT